MPEKSVGWWSNVRTLLGEQYWDTGWFGLLFTLIFAAFIVLNVRRARSSKGLFIRRIAGLNAIEEAVGRATEMGKPVLMVPGLSDPVNANAVQAINICSHVAKTAAKFSNPIIMCAYSASMYTLAQEVIRDTYQSEGYADRFDQDSVRFISDRQFAFAAGVSGIILREQTAAAFFLGEFYAESLIFAETANSIGAIQVASSTEATQTPFFIAACDYVLIGDEFYAASAYLTKEPVIVGSLVGQDWAKMLAIYFVIVGAVSQSIFARRHADMTTKAFVEAGGDVSKKEQAPEVLEKFGEASKKLKEEERGIFTVPKLFKPSAPPEDLDMERAKIEETKDQASKPEETGS
jgi:hypothetical protein